MEYYSVIKKNEIMSFAGESLELQNIMLSKVNQPQMVKDCMLFLICGSWMYKINLYISIYMILYQYTYR
jgi:hypothetical protein